MENASKALIMAAEILLGLAIISIGVYLYNTFGSYSKSTTSQIEQAQIAQFNNQFLKYYGSRTVVNGGVEKQEPIKCTIHDIASIVNLARKNNTEYEVTEKKDNNVYVQIEVEIKADTANGIPALKNENLEKKENNLVELIKLYDIQKTAQIIGASTEYTVDTRYYKCTECHINPITNRVDYMKFVDYDA